MNVKINRIVVATDGSDNMKNAVDWGTLNLQRQMML